MNHNGKRLPDGTKPKIEDLRDSVDAWVREISAKCAAYGMPVGVLLVVTPVQDPQPQYAHNMTPQGAQRILRHVAEDIAVKGGGIAVASRLPKA